MKIGLVLPYNVARGGGVQTLVFSYQKELRKRGYEAIVITPVPRNPEIDTSDFKNTIFVGNGTDVRSPLHTTPQISAGLSDEIVKVLKDNAFDIIHFHEPGVPMLSRQVLTRSKAINIATFHAAFPETIVGKSFAKVASTYIKPLLNYIDEYVAVSDVAAEYVRSLTKKNVTIIPNAVNLGILKAPKRIDDIQLPKTILYVGRLEERKGVDYLLRAYDLLIKNRQGVSLTIAGDGVDREKLEKLAKELGLNNVQFTGYISDEQKLDLFNTSDLFCAPSPYGESFGIVLLEAMATGLVTVAGNNPGYKSVLTGLGSLSLVNTRKVEEFAHRLELLLFENDLRNLWRAWARDQAKQYSIEKIVDQYEELYTRSLKKHQHKQVS